MIQRKTTETNNGNLPNSKSAKNDEFYTQYADIQREMNAYLGCDANVFRDKTILLPCDDPEWINITNFLPQNFEIFGLKKLISTSYAPDSKVIKLDAQPTLFETENPKFDASNTRGGKIFTLSRESDHENLAVDGLEWDYLNGDGDFRSDEVIALRDEVDHIIINPPSAS